MTFEDLINLTKFILNFNDGQADQDFSENRIKQALNHVYTQEVNRAKQEGSRRHFKAFVDFTWESGDTTMSLPAQISKQQLIRVEDVTSSSPGGRILFSENGLTGDVFFKDRSTLQWGTNGPGSDRTLRVFYFARPAAMVNLDDEPELIPPDHRELLAWAAAMRLRKIADERVPQSWVDEYDELRADLWKELSRGRPTDDVPWIDQAETDIETGDLS